MLKLICTSAALSLALAGASAAQEAETTAASAETSSSSGFNLRMPGEATTTSSSGFNLAMPTEAEDSVRLPDNAVSNNAFESLPAFETDETAEAAEQQDDIIRLD